MKPLTLLAASGLLLASTGSTAQPVTASLSHSLQCLLISSAMIESGDAKLKSAGLMSAMFFAGQVFGADPKIDLTTALKGKLPKLDAPTVARLQKDCGQELQARGGQITAAGEAIQASASGK